VARHLSTSRGRRFALAFTVATAIGAFAPWIDLGGTTVSGLDADDGVITMALAGIAFAYVVFGRAHWAPTAALGALIAAVGIIDIVDIEDSTGIIGLASPGWGLYLTAIAGIGLLGSAVFVMRGEGEEDLDVLGKVIVGLTALFLVLAVIGSLTEEDVAEVSVPDPSEVSPPD
jgi:hypothetical protein